MFVQLMELWLMRVFLFIISNFRLSSDTDVRNIVDQWKRNHTTTESKGKNKLIGKKKTFIKIDKLITLKTTIQTMQSN